MFCDTNRFLQAKMQGFLVLSFSFSFLKLIYKRLQFRMKNYFTILPVKNPNYNISYQNIYEFIITIYKQLKNERKQTEVNRRKLTHVNAPR